MENTYRIRQHPTAGALPILYPEEKALVASDKDKVILRELAKKACEVINLKNNEGLKKEWYRHNSLQKGRPLVLVYPEDSWFELINPEKLECEGEYWRIWEWYLKHLIYHAENLDDDYVFEPELLVEPVISHTGWGLEATYKKNRLDGSFIWEPPIKNYEDVERLKKPEVIYDKEETDIRMSLVSEMFSDIFPVKFSGITRICLDPAGDATTLRGMQELMYDMYDEPVWVHRLMKFISEGIEGIYNHYEEKGLLRANNRNHYVGSGGLGYTDELKPEQLQAKLSEMWGFGLAQEFSDVSPQQHEEFCLQYQLPYLNRCGMTAYGCCEPYTHKFNMIKKINNLRRVSVSPWCDIKKASEALEDKYILSFKPDPAMLAMKPNEDGLRKYFRNILDITKENHLEIVLKDTITVENHPERFNIWLRILREELQKM